jgi:hypothetical protein
MNAHIMEFVRVEKFVNVMMNGKEMIVVKRNALKIALETEYANLIKNAHVKNLGLEKIVVKFHVLIIVQMLEYV